MYGLLRCQSLILAGFIWLIVGPLWMQTRLYFKRIHLNNNMENQKNKVTLVPGTGSFKKETPDSSQVKSIEYDAKTKVFTINFKTSSYNYYGVSQEDATAAYNSKSFGALPRNELAGYKGVKVVEDNF